MFNDGMIGNAGLLEVLGNLTAVQFNKVLPKNHTPYKLQSIIPLAYDYIYPPLSEQDKKKQVSANLIAFAMQSPGAPSVLLKGK